MNRLLKFLSIGAVLIFLAYGSYYASNQYVSKQLFEQHQNEMVDEATVLLYATEIDNWNQDITKQQKKMIDEIATQNHQRISIISSEGILVYDSDPESETDIGDSLNLRPEVSAVMAGENVGADLRVSATLNHDYYYVAIPVIRDQQTIGILRLSEKADDFIGNVNQFKKLVIALLILFALLIIIMTANVWWTRRRREMELTQVLKKIKKGDYTGKHLLTSTGELSELGVTVRELAEELAQQNEEFHISEKRFEELLDVLNIGVLVISQSRKILRVNPIARQVLGVSGDSLSRDYHHYLPGVDLYEQVEQTFLTKQPFSEKKEWQQRWYKIKGNSILRDSQQQVIVLLYDITDVQNLVVHQNDFISNISHELKTPVTAIKGFSESLLDGAKDVPELNEEFLGIINQESLRLEKLIEDILELASVTGNPYGESSLVDMNQLMSAIQTQHQVVIDQKHLNFQLVMPKEVYYYGQGKQLHTLFDNLISNSLKYTPNKGTITVSVSESDGELVVEVHDDGMGIPEGDLTRIYERFYRVDKARSSEIKGTGLGLSLVKEIVSEHHGKIVITSEENRWTNVLVTLPKRVDH